MKKPIFIFDFDGTIADTFDYIVKISNLLAEQFHFKKIESHEIENLKDKNSQEIIRHLSIPLMKIPLIVTKAKLELAKSIHRVEPVEGLKEVLLQLKNLGCPMGILTSNSFENVQEFLHNHQFDFFEFVHSSSKIWSKNTTLIKLINEYNFPTTQLIYVGDETRDILAARKAGVKSAAVTWGYNSRKALSTHQPDYLLSSPDELLHLHSATFSLT